MSSFLPLALALVVIITVAKLGGYASYRLGQPTVLGELIMGLIIGPTVLNVFHLPVFEGAHVGDVINELAEFGVLLLMFIAGLELHLSELVRSGKISFLAGTFGVITPIIMGFGAARLFGIEPQAALFIGLILAATSVSISAQTLMELKALRSRVGVSLLGSAVFDDILVVLGLSIFTALALGGDNADLGHIVWIILRMVGYLVVATVLGFWLLPRRLARWTDNLPISQGLIAFVFTVMLFYSWSAETIGNMATVVGAFLAGLVFARSPLKAEIERGMSTLAYGLFVPIFFVNIGLSANIRELSGDGLPLLIGLAVVAIASKIIGSGLGARLGGLSNLESLQLGVGMMSRGEVVLIVVTVGIELGLIESNIFSIMVGIVILTTLLTPPLLRALFAHKETQTIATTEAQSIGEPS